MSTRCRWKPSAILRSPTLFVGYPPRRRLIIFLRYYADLSYAQIAHLCEVSEGTVAATIAQGQAQLAQTVRKDEVTA